MFNLAVAILDTAAKREDSWDKERNRYQLSLDDAALACCHNQAEQELVLILLSNGTWNDAIAWAQRQGT